MSTLAAAMLRAEHLTRTPLLPHPDVNRRDVPVSGYGTEVATVISLETLLQDIIVFTPAWCFLFPTLIPVAVF